MLVADGLHIGFRLASANRHEVILAASPVQSAPVPLRECGCPQQRSKEIVADEAYDSGSYRIWLRSYQTNHPSLRAARTQSSQSRTSCSGGRPGVWRALEGGTDLCLAGQVSEALGAPRVLPFDLPYLSTHLHPRVAEATLKCQKLREDGVEVEPFDELPAAPNADLLEDVLEVFLDGVLGDVEGL
jgi:hypothetical protein